MSTVTPEVLVSGPGDACFKGVQHTGIATGKSIQIAGIPTYVSKPSPADDRLDANGKERIVLFLADVFGPFFVNNQLIMDWFAQHGFLVLGIDYFLGDPVHLHTEEGFDRKAWVQNAREKAVSAFPQWIEGVRDIYGEDRQYFAVGYCFGAPFALELAATDKVAASAFAHPGSLNEDHFSNIKQPLFLSCAETDSAFPLESRRRAEDLLVAAQATYHIQVFSGVKHGFATRGDPAVENERWAKEESARGIIGWFARFSK